MKVHDLRGIARLLSRLRDRILLMTARCTLSLVDDRLRMQEVQVLLLSAERRSGLERVQEYGFTSVPLPGAEAVAVFYGGNRADGAVVATDDRRHRPRGWAPGEVGLYAVPGQLLKMDEAGNLHINAPGDIVLNAGGNIRATAEADVELRGTVVASHGRERVQYDANGYGQVWEFASGWRLLSYTIGASPGQTFPISPPEIPADG